MNSWNKHSSTIADIQHLLMIMVSRKEQQKSSATFVTISTACKNANQPYPSPINQIMGYPSFRQQQESGNFSPSEIVVMVICALVITAAIAAVFYYKRKNS